MGEVGQFCDWWVCRVRPGHCSMISEQKRKSSSSSKQLIISIQSIRTGTLPNTTTTHTLQMLTRSPHLTPHCPLDSALDCLVAQQAWHNFVLILPAGQCIVLCSWSHSCAMGDLESAGDAVADMRLLSELNPPIGLRGAGDGLMGLMDEECADAMSEVWSDALSIAGGAQRGRKRSIGPRACGLCRESSDSDDPVAIILTPTMLLLLKWAYPPINGKPQGQFCWYCIKVVDNKSEYAGMTATAVKLMIDNDEAKRQEFHKGRKECIEIAISNNGQVKKCEFSQRDVMHYRQTGMHHKRHGRAMTLARYKEKFGKAATKSQIGNRINAKGKLV